MVLYVWGSKRHTNATSNDTMRENDKQRAKKAQTTTGEAGGDRGDMWVRAGGLGCDQFAQKGTQSRPWMSRIEAKKTKDKKDAGIGTAGWKRGARALSRAGSTRRTRGVELAKHRDDLRQA